MARILSAAVAMILVPTAALAQINFQKTGYYAAMGDSVAAGEGAVPVTTNGYAYQLYEQGVFGPKQAIDFANLGLRGGRSWDLLGHQVPELLCAEPAQRPTVITITAGANDFLRGDQDIVGIASRVVQSINLLLNNGTPAAGVSVMDPANPAVPCRRIENVTILVSNYYRIPHPEPAVAAILDSALQGYDYVLRALLGFVPVPAGSRVEVVDLYGPSIDREGLLLIERRFGYSGPLDFEIHPTNLGHTFIAKQFEAAWKRVQ